MLWREGIKQDREKVETTGGGGELNVGRSGDKGLLVTPHFYYFCVCLCGQGQNDG